MKEIRFAVVGLGNIAKTHILIIRALPIFKKLPFVAVLDTLISRNPEQNRDQANTMGFNHVSPSLEEALTERKIDVVDICTPNAMHMEAVKTAASAGKAIYCEKPLTEEYEQSLALNTMVPNALLKQTALVFRYHPAIMRIREILRHEMIGELLQCHISYRISGYLDASRPFSWRLLQSLSGGGAITDLGVHVLDLFHHLFGDIDSVNGTTQINIKKRPIAQNSNEYENIHVDDWAHLHVIMQSGLKGTMEVSRIAWGSEAFQIQIYGSKGSITCDLDKEMHPHLKLLDGSSPVLPLPASLDLLPDEKSSMGILKDCHFASLNHFLHRYIGQDAWKGLAPSFEDCLFAEKYIDDVLQNNRSI